ncbi:unnamed protein product [Phytomonas sp. EM1]|nr:unnamed protein product [Phytomonas sp. EM1]|eukprot:CCW60071.1 unnamed protein product [Phytomonas sp. isolate EM1]
MSVWVVCFVYIRFDLDIGPKIEYITPHDALTENGKSEVIKYAFPDCNPDCDHNFIFNFSLEDCTQAAAQVIPETVVANPGKGSIISRLYGAAYYRQKYDTRVQRSYVQQAIVLLSRLPFIAAHELILRTVAPRFAQCCTLSPDTELTTISGALSPFPSNFYHMDPSYNPDQYTPIQVLDEAIKEIAGWPSPHPQVRYEVLLLHQVLVFVTGPHSFIAAQPHQWQQHAVKRPPFSLDHRVSFMKRRTSIGFDASSKIFYSQELLPLFDLLGEHITHLTYLWELVISHEPLFILSNTPSTASAAAMAVASLVSPIPYTGVISSYFTMQSNEFTRFTRMGKALPFPTTEGMIVAGTNPLLIRSFDGWPSLLAVVDRFVRARGEEPHTTTSDLGDSAAAHRIASPITSLSPNRPFLPINTAFPTNSAGCKVTKQCFNTTSYSSSPFRMRRWAPSSGVSNGGSESFPVLCPQGASQGESITVTEKDKTPILPYGSFFRGNATNKSGLASPTVASLSKHKAKDNPLPLHTSGGGYVCEGLDIKKLDLNADPPGSCPSPQSSSCFSKNSRQFMSCSSNSANYRDHDEGRLELCGNATAFDSGRRYRLQSSSTESSSDRFPISDDDIPDDLDNFGGGANDAKRTGDSQHPPLPHPSLPIHFPQRVGSTIVPLITSVTSVLDVQPQLQSLSNPTLSCSHSGKASELKHTTSHLRNNSYDYTPLASKHGLASNESKLFTPEQYRTLREEAAHTPQRDISTRLSKGKESRNRLQHRLVNHFDSTFNFLLNHKEQTSYLLKRLEAASASEKEGQIPPLASHVDPHHCERKLEWVHCSSTSFDASDAVSSFSDPPFSQFSVGNSVMRKFFDSLTHEFLSPITFWFMNVTRSISSFSLCDVSVAESILCADKFLDFFRENHKRIAPGLWTRHHRYTKYKTIYERFARGSLFQAYVKQLLGEKLFRELDGFEIEEWVKAFPYEAERIDMIINLYNVAKRELTHTLDPDVVFITSVTSVLARMALRIDQPLQDQLLMKIADLKL